MLKFWTSHAGRLLHFIVTKTKNFLNPDKGSLSYFLYDVKTAEVNATRYFGRVFQPPNA